MEEQEPFSRHREMPHGTGRASFTGSAGRAAASTAKELLLALACVLQNNKWQRARASSSPSCLRKPLEGKRENNIKRNQHPTQNNGRHPQRGVLLCYRRMWFRFAVNGSRRNSPSLGKPLLLCPHSPAQPSLGQSSGLGNHCETISAPVCISQGPAALLMGHPLTVHHPQAPHGTGTRWQGCHQAGTGLPHHAHGLLPALSPSFSY